MNDWGKIKPLVICEADDFQNKYDRNGLEMLFYWKAKYPQFKITLFTIPNKTSMGMLDLIGQHNDWIELAIHGWDHDSNYECWSWDYEKTQVLMNRVEMGYFKPIFKAPGWTITGQAIKDITGKIIGGKYSGYPPSDELPVAQDHQAVYKALKDMDFIVVDRHYDKEARPEGLKVICIDCQTNFVHGHTWDMITGELAAKNGLRQIEELHGVPWDTNSEFFFISEAWEKGMIEPCKNP